MTKRTEDRQADGRLTFSGRCALKIEPQFLIEEPISLDPRRSGPLNDTDCLFRGPMETKTAQNFQMTGGIDFQMDLRT
jgi:hypothetical protein